MQQAVRRLFVEKKAQFDIAAGHLFEELKNTLGISGLTGIRIINRYDVEGLTEIEYAEARKIIFAEPTVDQVYDEVLPIDEAMRLLITEYLPGQYDQRADSAAQCIQILSQRERPEVKVAKLVVCLGTITDEEFERIKAYCINPLEAQEASVQKPETLKVELSSAADVAIMEGFITCSAEQLEQLRQQLGLAMSGADLTFCQEYFRDTERRNPTITEIRVLDTYWSDHCRHTTFQTKIEAVEIGAGLYTAGIKAAYQSYLDSRDYVYGDHPKVVTLMDLALIAAKECRKRGLLDDLEESDEINACSIVVPVKVDGETQEWLVMFKNETHNHPTEIEPFGGAATCLGGAIRDPLSGRSYVYHAMRVTGSGDPTKGIAATLSGKLPQRKITTGAMAGFSAYGNQIGLATGQVAEIYDEGYVAKRMEIGAVIGAAPRENVIREQSAVGDIIVLLGGRTGRDGCGGATGSSKEHDENSLQTCGAEVQKGNPPTERKIQRLFRNPVVSRMIKKCNDFGAGGVAVAIGELADGLEINLDAVPKKYEGLDGTELAISESQERMAVLVAPEQVKAFCLAAAVENLETTVVAQVTEKPRLQMFWRGKTIVDISREFLNTNGVQQTAEVVVAAPDATKDFFAVTAKVSGSQECRAAWLKGLSSLNQCSQKGLGERFDSTIGGGTVLMPFGGKYQLTPIQTMVAKIPVLDGETTTATLMAHGYNPELSRWSPFHGGLYAVIESIAKLVATGADYRKIRLTLQEYFEKLGTDAAKWGKPFAALLGAYYAQAKLGIPAIGGKDSMSGTFKDLNVPPTLVSFAVTTAETDKVISTEFKAGNSKLVLIPLSRTADGLPVFEELDCNFKAVNQMISAGKVLSAWAIGGGGVAEALAKMAFGNMIGVVLDETISGELLFKPDYGSILLEVAGDVGFEPELAGVTHQLLGHTCERPELAWGKSVLFSLEEALEVWQRPLAKVFPERAETLPGQPLVCSYQVGSVVKPRVKVAKPRVFIPVFPGTNCEYDTCRAFEKAGAIAETFVFRNLTPADIELTIDAMVQGINKAQIVMLPGGFSAGDEPDGSGKFIATAFRNPRIKEAVTQLLQQRDGLMLGICNGFQALIKLGLVPYGEIRDLTPEAPTLTYNTLGRHVSCLVRTKVASNLSPWLSQAEVGAVHTVAVSHGEGRFIADEAHLKLLQQNGQIATQYVDLDGNPTYDSRFNPNGSVAAVEGITSPDGRVFGKMGHSERYGKQLYLNVPGEKDQRIFASGVSYFS